MSGMEIRGSRQKGRRRTQKGSSEVCPQPIPRGMLMHTDPTSTWHLLEEEISILSFFPQAWSVQVQSGKGWTLAKTVKRFGLFQSCFQCHSYFLPLYSHYSLSWVQFLQHQGTVDLRTDPDILDHLIELPTSLYEKWGNWASEKAR